MLNIKPKYLVDEAGRKTGAVLSMKDYRRLMQRHPYCAGFRDDAAIRDELRGP